MSSGDIDSLETLLTRLAQAGAEDSEAGEDETVSLGDMLDAVGRRAFGPVLLLPGIVILSPVIGDIPTVPTMMATVIILAAAQLLLRRRTFWFPGWLTRRSVKRKTVRKAARKLKKPARWVDRLLRRRLVALTGATGSMVIAATCVALSLAIPPMELIPFSATVAGTAVTGFGVALIAEDGLVALLSFLVTVSALALGLSALL